MVSTLNSKCSLKSELHEREFVRVIGYDAAADLHTTVTNALWDLAYRMWIMQFNVSCIINTFRCWKRSSSSAVVHI